MATILYVLNVSIVLSWDTGSLRLDAKVMLSSLGQNQIPDGVSIKRTRGCHFKASMFWCQFRHTLFGGHAKRAGRRPECGYVLVMMGIEMIQPNAGQHESTGGRVARGSSWSVIISCAVCQLWGRGHERVMVAAVF